jgi:hypothetical protein
VSQASRQVFRERQPAVITHWVVDGQAVVEAKQVVIRAVAGRDVDETGARVIGHEIRRQQPARAVAEWMLVLDLFQMPGLERAQFLVAVPPELLREGRQQTG